MRWAFEWARAGLFIPQRLERPGLCLTCHCMLGKEDEAVTGKKYSNLMSKSRRQNKPATPCRCTFRPASAGQLTHGVLAGSYPQRGASEQEALAFQGCACLPNSVIG